MIFILIPAFGSILDIRHFHCNFPQYVFSIIYYIQCLTESIMPIFRYNLIELITLPEYLHVM